MIYIFVVPPKPFCSLSTEERSALTRQEDQADSEADPAAEEGLSSEGAGAEVGMVIRKVTAGIAKWCSLPFALSHAPLVSLNKSHQHPT